MTALFLDLGIAKSTRIPGFPLDGLPPLEPGGTLGGAFAEALGKAATGSDAEGADAPVEGDGGDDALPDGADPQALASDAGGLPMTVAIPASPTTPKTDTATPSETGKATAIAAAPGKTLPDAQPDIAVALAISPKEGDGAAKAQKTQDSATTTQQGTGTAQPLALLAMRGLTIPANATGSAQPGGDQAAGAAPAARAASASDTATALDPTALAAKGENGSAPGEGKGESRGDGAQRGDAKGEAAGRLATKLASTAAAGKADTDSAQQGFSINVRAAERAGATDGPQAGLSSPTGTAALVAGAAPGAATHAPLGAASGTANAMPGFPELAALVDRIAAARDSAGGGSATVSLAHKELGNLSLTFETSGRTLDVQVSAQDNETQRSLAAALAADRPHIRAAEAQQAPSQQHQQQAGAQGGTTTHGGQADARQSGAAGDGQSDRRDNARQAGRGAGSGQPGSGPKSDGGIYA
ncbi:hypothetical protein ABC955_00015 [Citromicrobium bathyomarinum]